jgi:hypothetical protein
MSARWIVPVSTLLGIVLLASAAWADKPGDKPGQDGKKKQQAGEKVELKDLPPAVIEAAKKEAPNANWSSAEKRLAKKQGTIYTLEGSDGKFQLSLMATSSGELMRFTKATQRKGKK